MNNYVPADEKHTTAHEELITKRRKSDLYLDKLFRSNYPLSRNTGERGMH